MGAAGDPGWPARRLHDRRDLHVVDQRGAVDRQVIGDQVDQ
jgi:hypothetical protein